MSSKRVSDIKIRVALLSWTIQFCAVQRPEGIFPALARSYAVFTAFRCCGPVLPVPVLLVALRAGQAFPGCWHPLRSIFPRFRSYAAFTDFGICRQRFQTMMLFVALLSWTRPFRAVVASCAVYFPLARSYAALTAFGVARTFSDYTVSVAAGLNKPFAVSEGIRVTS